MRKRKKIILLLCLCILAIGGFWWHSIKPSNDRTWTRDQQILPFYEMNGDDVTIHHIRNFTYRTRDDYDVAYYDKTFNLSKISSVWYIVEPFSDFKGAAHTFLSFGFQNGYYVGISVEIRKEVGEKFSALKGIFKQYELMYVIGDERDLIGLRSNIRNDDVYVYPIKATPDQIRTLFVSMLTRANTLRDHPEFYNSFTNTCTTNIVHHINMLSPKSIPWSYKILMPAYSDSFAFDLGLIDTNLPLEEARQQFHINERAMTYAKSSDFSKRIRE
jgi:hypothetical protein